jgi:hypothetical protein
MEDQQVARECKAHKRQSAQSQCASIHRLQRDDQWHHSRAAARRSTPAAHQACHRLERRRATLQRRGFRVPTAA